MGPHVQPGRRVRASRSGGASKLKADIMARGMEVLAGPLIPLERGDMRERGDWGQGEVVVMSERCHVSHHGNQSYSNH